MVTLQEGHMVYEESSGQSMDVVKALIASQRPLMKKFSAEAGVEIEDLLENFLTSVYLNMMKNSHTTLMSDKDFASQCIKVRIQWLLNLSIPWNGNEDL